MSKLFSIGALLVLVLVTSCQKSKKAAADEEESEVACVLKEGLQCGKLAHMDSVEWFTLSFQRVGAPDSTALFAKCGSKTVSTNVYSLLGQPWRYIKGDRKTLPVDSLCADPEIFLSDAKVTAIGTQSKEEIMEQAKIAYDAEVDQMKSNALAFFKALENSSDSFANYCTPELAKLGRRLHNEYEQKGISYQAQDKLPGCPYFGYYEDGFMQVHLQGCDPLQGKVVLTATGAGEGMLWDIIFTCTMEKVDGKWVIARIGAISSNEREDY